MTRLATILVFIAALAVSSHGAYLPRTGPLPLRFKAATVDAALIAHLPPLPMTNEVTSHVAPVVVATKTPPPAEVAEPLGPVLQSAEDPMSLPVSTVRTTAPASVNAETNNAPNVQTLVRFFAPSGNTNRDIAVIAPVFTPPPAAPRSSTATFEQR